ncbi:MAG: hypothetical protein AAGD04_07450 [Pseudomonadota bacterium]
MALNARGVRGQAVYCDPALAASVEAGGGQIAQTVGKADLVVAAPDIALQDQKPVLQALEAQVPLESPLGLFFRSFGAEDWAHYERVPRVVVTPSAVIAQGLTELLEAVGKTVQSAVSGAAMGLDIPDDGSFVVLTASEVEVATARALTPDVVILPDTSCARLLREGGPDHAILDVGSFDGAFLSNMTREAAVDDRVIACHTGGKIAGPGWSVFLNKGFLTETRRGKQVQAVDLRALATSVAHTELVFVYAAARALGLNPRQIASALPSLPDRLTRSPSG